MDITDLIPIPVEFGYVGLGLVSFFGSLVPFVPLPAFVFLATMSVGDQFNIHILAILSALLSAGAKQIIFYVSYSGRRIMTEKTRNRMKPFERLVKRYGAGAAFIAAATPIPDDLVYIPLGLAKYNPKKFFVATVSGKIILHYVIVLGAHFLGQTAIVPLLGDIDDATPIYIGIIIFGVLVTAMIILLLRLDWARVLGKIAPWTLYDDEHNKE